MKLKDLSKYGHLPAPIWHVRDFRAWTRERCPECGRGRVVHVSDYPWAVRFVCSRNCGWDA